MLRHSTKHGLDSWTLDSWTLDSWTLDSWTLDGWTGLFKPKLGRLYSIEHEKMQNLNENEKLTFTALLIALEVHLGNLSHRQSFVIILYNKQCHRILSS